MNDLQHITVAVPAAKVGALYAAVALLHGTTAMTPPALRGSTAEEAGTRESANKSNAAEIPNGAANAETAAPKAGDTAPAASQDDGTVDAGGWPWSADLHASTKGVTKEGFWRMKVGVSRPDPKPGFPKADGAAAAAAAPAGGNSASTAPAADEEDEFAAFRTAAAEPAKAVARTWTDADLSALCNQAASKLGDPAPIRDLIVEYLPEGAVTHSRNIAADQREAFAKALEAKAGIEFAG